MAEHILRTMVLKSEADGRLLRLSFDDDRLELSIDGLIDITLGPTDIGWLCQFISLYCSKA